MESDPIGLNGGINTYGYVGARPLILVDQLGLDPGDMFATPDDAAIDAGRYGRRQKDQSIEYGGWIYKVGNCWTYNYFPGEPPQEGDWWKGRLNPDDLNKYRPNGARIIWHTHVPAGILSEQEGFSGNWRGDMPGDMSSSRHHNVGIYLNTPRGLNAYYDYYANPDNPYRELENKEPCKCNP